MDNFIYYTPTKIYFGKGEENHIGDYLKPFHPHKILIVYGGGSIIRSGLLDRITSLLDKDGYNYLTLGGVRANPELPLVREGISLAIKEEVDFVLAIGGGSVLDTAKDIANGVANKEDDVWDYHLKKKSPKASLNKGCILTIAAAGSEMSNSCVITNPDTHIKAGYNSDYNRYNFAIMNPELTYTLPPYQIACGAVDIAMHSIERFFALGDDVDITDDICLSVIKNAFKYGKLSYLNPTDYNARSNLMWASSLAHNDLTHCGRTFFLTVHQLEHALSALYPDIAHGAGLAALWCSWARLTYKSNLSRWKKYMEVVWDISFKEDNIEEMILKGIDKQEDYYRSINMPISIKEFNVKESDLELLALKVSNNKSRTLPGFYPLGYDEIYKIFLMSYLNK